MLLSSKKDGPGFVLAGSSSLASLLLLWPLAQQALFILPVLAFLAFLAAWAIKRLRLESSLMLLLAFILPLSVPVPFVLDSMLRLPSEPIVAVAATLCILHLMGQKPVTSSSIFRESLWVLPLFAILFLTTVFSEMPFVSVKFTGVNVMYILSFYLLGLQLSRDDPGLFPRMMLAYGAGFVLVTAWAMIQYAAWDWNPVVMRGIFRPFYNDHTIFGAAAALMAVFWAATGLAAKGDRYRFLYWLLSAFFLAAVVLSTSRAAFLSLLFALLTYLVFRFRPRPVVLVMAGLLFMGTIWYGQSFIRERIHQVETLSYDSGAGWVDRQVSVANVSTDVSNLERLNRWRAAWQMFRERPLSGFGPGTYQFQYIPYQDPALMNRLTVTDPYNVPEGSGGTAHSEYFLALSETGLFGLLAWLLLPLRWLWLAFRSRGQRGANHQVMVGILALSTYFFHGAVNNFLTTDQFAFLFWGAGGWLVAGSLSEQCRLKITSP